MLRVPLGNAYVQPWSSRREDGIGEVGFKFFLATTIRKQTTRSSGWSGLMLFHVPANRESTLHLKLLQRRVRPGSRYGMILAMAWSSLWPGPRYGLEVIPCGYYAHASRMAYLSLKPVTSYFKTAYVARAIIDQHDMLAEIWVSDYIEPKCWCESSPVI